LVSDETNYFMRFRYPILPVILVSWVPVARAFADRARIDLASSRTARAAAAVGAVLAAAALGLWQHRRFAHIEPQRMGLYDVAVMLRAHADRGYTIATTEAGLLPLYSEWRAVDAWGLNDAWIAHHGGITEEYLERYRPEVIALHAYFSPAAPPAGPEARARGLGPAWFEMVATLQRYAESRGYTLAAAFGRDPADTHYYYVRPGFAEAEAITARIRGMRYLWNGRPARNYAAGEVGSP
jgi:arabinofuranosyltransferase